MVPPRCFFQRSVCSVSCSFLNTWWAMLTVREKVILTCLSESCDLKFFPRMVSILKSKKFEHALQNTKIRQIKAKSATSLVAQMVKNLSPVQETLVWSLDQEVPLKKGMATRSSILVWKIPQTEEPSGLQFIGLPRIGHDWVTEHMHILHQNAGFSNIAHNDFTHSIHRDYIQLHYTL